MEKTEQIQSIINEISTKGKDVCIFDDRNYIKQFIDQVINGDSLIDHLVIAATLSKDRKGILTYLLTTGKIAKIEIDKEKVQSNSCYLQEVTGVNRKLLSHAEGNNYQMTVEFPHGSFGLLYPANDIQIDAFFQKLDAVIRKVKVAPNG